MRLYLFFFFFKQKTAYEVRISDWSSDVCSSDLNAFALPGGYVYITRGLMALANSEAELAGVMGHEIGHVTARHTAQRYSQAILANIGMMGVAIATGSGALANLAGSGAQLYLQSYSRDQEFEADTLGVRYISRATRSEEHTSEL